MTSVETMNEKVSSKFVEFMDFGTGVLIRDLWPVGWAL